ncbi:hypothetical protein K0M31_014824 [Melipona bicolor]|uniref:Uncharacterized protein n=1 Tax=Melipona bicolor TaxID=60889 RepID=A0AA40FGC6_9HYME|nr:hypothetical protein K0M31_014824 [Melipona bicolor]
MHCCVTNGRPSVQDPVESKKRSSCDDTSDRVVRASANSCETVERIGRFFRTYLSKGKRRRRCKKKRKGRQQSFDVAGNTLQIAKSKGLDSADLDRNRTTIEDTVAVVSSVSSVSSSSSQLAATAIATATAIDSSPQTVPLPINTSMATTTTAVAPPLSRSYSKPSALHRSSLITEFDLLDTQQNRSLLRSQKTLGSSTYRRPSTHFFLRRGQKAKINSQMITQSIKLSPILESELSKPVTPRSTHSSLSSYSGLSNRSICSTSSSSSSSSQVARDSLFFHEKCEIHRIE